MSTQGGLNIVTNGLVFEVDAANKLGGNVSSTKNLCNPTETGNFVNGTSVVDGVYDFDGVDDYIDFGNVLNGFGGKFTFETWVKFNSTGSSTSCICYKTKTSSTADFGFFGQGPSAKFQFIDDFVGTALLSNTSSQVANVWFHVAVTWDTNIEMKMYVNGVLEKTEVSSFGYSDNNAFPFQVGAAVNGTVLFFNGQMKGLNISNKILTATEIKQNYEALKHRFDDN